MAKLDPAIQRNKGIPVHDWMAGHVLGLDPRIEAGP